MVVNVVISMDILTIMQMSINESMIICMQLRVAVIINILLLATGRVAKFKILMLRGLINFCCGYNLLCEGSGQKHSQ